MKRFIVIAMTCGAALVLYIASIWFIDHNIKPDSTDEAINQQMISSTNNFAEPGLGGFYQIEWKCHGKNQIISFHILTRDEGYLDVTIEEIDPDTQPYTVTRALSERVLVSSQNRDEVESRTFSSIIPAGHAVHIGLSGEGGAKTSENQTFSPQKC